MQQRLNARRLSIALALIVVLGAAAVWSLWPRHTWQVRSYSLAHETLERTVFELEFEAGTQLAYRLDPKPGAQATLVLHTPSGEAIVWDRPFRRTREVAELTVMAPGVYRLALVTEPATTPPGATAPEVEVLWRTR